MSSGVIYAVTWALPPYTRTPIHCFIAATNSLLSNTFTFTPIFAVNMTTSLQKKLILAVYHFLYLEVLKDTEHNTEHLQMGPMKIILLAPCSQCCHARIFSLCH